MSDEVLIRYKMILFGDKMVGKSSLVDRYVNDKFEQDYISTLGYNVLEKRIQYKDSTISLIIYDIGGQEEYDAVRKIYAKGSSCAFLVYDITNKTSFENITKWRNDLKDYAGEIPFIIIGNKNDLESERVVSRGAGEKSSSELGALSWFETSAKTGIGVENAFMDLAIKSYEIKNVM